MPVPTTTSRFGRAPPDGRVASAAHRLQAAQVAIVAGREVASLWHDASVASRVEAPDRSRSRSYGNWPVIG